MQADSRQVGGCVQNEREVLVVLLSHPDEQERELGETVEMRRIEGKVCAEVANEILMEVERGHKFEPEIEGT